MNRITSWLSREGRHWITAVTVAMTASITPAVHSASISADSLASWQNNATLKKITQFVADVSNPASKHFQPAEKRIAVVDNDGTLWAEKPLYPQVAFLVNHIQQQGKNPSFQKRFENDEVISALIEGDLSVLKGLKKTELFERLTRPWEGVAVADYQQRVRNFLQTDRNLKYPRTHQGMVYQPMLELLRYLEQNQFTVYIVTGGGEDFVSAISGSFYDIPADRVIGTRTRNRKTEAGILKGYQLANDINEGHYKVQGIQQRIGQQPLIAVGNSDGDFNMLATTADAGGLAVLLKHTDAEREFNYDKGAEKSQAMATEHSNWLSVDMKKDFETPFR